MSLHSHGVASPSFLAGLAGLASLLSATSMVSSGCAQVYLGWLQQAPAASPSPRAATVMVYDEERGRVVLFGGWSNVAANCCALDDTWEWDGVTWLQRQPATVPPARAGAVAVYDRQRQRVVMFGGGDFSTLLADTWQWDGDDWTQASPAVSPPARMLGGAAYDAVRGQTVLFGGFDGVNYRDDTWVWDGVSWAAMATGIRPSPRKQMAMVADVAAGVILLFGGEAGAGALYGDTWIWNGTTWSQPSTGSSPGPLWATGAAFDPMRGRSVLFGGFHPGGITNEMWEWDGATWSLRGALQSPSPRQNPGFVFTATGEAVMYGGLAVAAGGAFDDTWTFRAGYPPHFGTFGAGCAGSLGTPQLGKHPGFAQLPWLGTVFGLCITNVPTGLVPPFVLFGVSNTSHQGLALPLSLAALGMPGCSLWTSIDVVASTAASGNQASLLIGIPPTTSILGARLFGQALLFDVGANPFGATVSNGCEMIIGSR